MNKIKLLPLTVFIFLINSSFVSAAGLDKAKGVLESFQTELTTIIPIAATLLLVIMAVGYAGRFMEKDTFVRWAIGIIVAGSAAQITALFFS